MYCVVRSSACRSCRAETPPAGSARCRVCLPAAASHMRGVSYSDAGGSDAGTAAGFERSESYASVGSDAFVRRTISESSGGTELPPWSHLMSLGPPFHAV